jgi:hypothetical protein
MPLDAETLRRARAEIAREQQDGKISEEEAGRRLVEADPAFGGGYFLLGRARQEAGDLDAAEGFFWQALERMPADFSPYFVLSEIRKRRIPDDALGHRLFALGAWKLALRDEIPEDIADLFGKLEDENFDFRDPETFEMLAMSLEKEDPPPDVRDRLLPYEHLNELQRHAESGLKPDLLREILAHAGRSIPVWRGALRQWAADPDSLFPADIGIIVALLGETAGPEALDNLLDCTDPPDEEVFRHANWAVWRMGTRHPEETLAAFRAAARTARLSVRCAMAEQLGLFPRMPGIETALLGLLDGFDKLARYDDAPFLLAAVIDALDRQGRTADIEKILRQFPALMPKSARRELHDLLEEGYEPRIVRARIQGVTIEEVCCVGALMDDVDEDEDEENPYDGDEDDEEFDEDFIEPVVAAPKPGRNDPCWCGSGKKYKKCHLAADEESERGGSVKGEAKPIHVRLLDELIGSMTKWHSKKDLERAVSVYFGRPPDAVSEELEDDDRRAGFLEWYVHDYRPATSGRTIIEEHLRRRGGGLPAAEREWLESWRAARFGLWEIQSVNEGEGVEVKDVFAGDGFFVHDVSSSRSLVRWDCILSRIHQLGGKWYFAGNSLGVPRSLVPQLTEQVERESRDAGRSPVEYLRANSHRWHLDVFEAHKKQLAGLQVVNAEGDLMEFGAAEYEVRDEAAVLAALAAAKPFEAGTDDEPGIRTFAWLEQTKGPRRSYGHIEVREGKLRLECNSRERLEIGRQLVEKHAGRWLGHLGDSFQSLDEIKQRALDPNTEPREPEKSSIPPEVEREIIARYKAEHYAHWVDEPLPALHGRTPREASRSEAGRRDLEALLRYMENGEERARRAGRAAFDWSSVRKTLGM